MADEDLSVAPEPAQPTIPEPQQDDGPQAIPDPSSDNQEPAVVVEPDEELEEFEWNGKTYHGPKGLKDGILMRADHTRKTQDISEQRKAFEAEKAEHAKIKALSDEEMDLRVNLRGMDARLADYAKLSASDWAAHRANNPIETDNAWTEYQLLKEQRAEVAKNLEGKTKERSEGAQRDFAKRVQETTDFAEKNIPNWSEDMGIELVEFATANGASKAFVGENMSPALIQFLHWARLGKQTLSTPAPKPITTPATPLRVVKAGSAPTGTQSLADLAKSDNMDAFAKGLKEKMAKRG